MRVALVAYLLHTGADYRAAGVSTYIRELLAELPCVAPQHEYLAFHGRDGELPPGIKSRRAPIDTQHALRRIAWEQSGLVWEMRSVKPDVVHGTVNVTPLLSSVPSVVTVHDLAFLRHPECFHRAKVAYLKAAVRGSVRRAAHVIAVSENTRQDVIELLSAPEDHVSVAYPGINRRFQPQAAKKVAQGRARRFGGRPYILHVGTLEPRKNIDVLIRAFLEARVLGRLPHILALIGARGWMYDALYALVRDLHLEDDVRFLDWVTPEDLPLWYSCADLFVYPSVYEGFGMPVAEAMSCGVPVVTSATGALMELSGGAALVVEPDSVESLASALVRGIENREERQQMREAGCRRAAGFRWAETARRTVAAYERLKGQ